jgi:Membrane domain of glycerophosphoryl diester phosphodiesterase
MRALSISRAWDESKAILTRDGQLYVSVALALVAFPTLVTGIINPKGMGGSTAPFWVSAVSMIASLVALAGQLALIRLALGPSVTVGGAINHGMRRMPIYLLAAILILVALMVTAIPFAAVLAAIGVPIQGGRLPATPPVLVAALLYLVLACFIGVRMAMSAPAASAEPIGPVRILRRSWDLTAGHFWRLLAFLIVYFIAAAVVLIGLGSAVSVLVALLLGKIEPMSLSALVAALIHALLNATITVFLAVMVARIYVQLAGRDEAESGVPITGI